MTDSKLSRSDIPSNEEIIDDLTKDLEAQQLDESEESDTETKKQVDDFIDEEKLKEIEATLTEEEKLSRKQDAEKLKQDGNEQFKNGLFKESIETYTSALKICPLAYSEDRSILYSNRSASKIKLDYRESALEDCTKAVELNPSYVKALRRRAKLQEDMEKLDESLEDYKKLQTINPSDPEVNRAIYELQIRIEQRNEELKKEMLGKLKDLGNVILKPFGLSTDNFQLNKDPNSGGYSINFTQNRNQ